VAENAYIQIAALYFDVTALTSVIAWHSVNATSNLTLLSAATRGAAVAPSRPVRPVSTLLSVVKKGRFKSLLKAILS